MLETMSIQWVKNYEYLCKTVRVAFKQTPHFLVFIYNLQGSHTISKKIHFGGVKGSSN